MRAFACNLELCAVPPGVNGSEHRSIEPNVTANHTVPDEETPANKFAGVSVFGGSEPKTDQAARLAIASGAAALRARARANQSSG